MWLEFLWMSVNVLFFIFAPLFAAHNGIPIGDLWIYYPIVGGVLIATRLVVGPRLDGLRRCATPSTATGGCRAAAPDPAPQTH